MLTGAHLLISWISTVELLHERRERTLVTLAGIAPDLDGLGIIADSMTGTTAFYLKYHHYVGHSALSALIIASLAAVSAKTQHLSVWLLSVLVVHLHVLADVAGSKGPDGYQWPIYYLYPFNSAYELTWSGQWELDAWQNQAVMVVLLSICIYYAATRKISFLEVFSEKIDKDAFQLYEKYVRRRF